MMPGRQNWSASTIVLHWLSAALMIGLLALGWEMVHGDLDAADKFDLYQWHKSFGFLALILTALRLGARAATAAPERAPVPSWERRVAEFAHAALYGLTLISAISGWLVASTAVVAIPTRFFDLFVIPAIAMPDLAAFEQMALLHAWTSRALMVLIALHIAAALKHHFIDGDNLLTKMASLSARRRR
jgi:cytochrome b561